VLVGGFPAGPWGTNCYVIATEPGAECVIVDPGKDSAGGIEDLVSEHGLKPVAVLLTHGHIDHVWSVVPVCGARGIPAFIHPNDRAMLSDPLSAMSPQSVDMLASMTEGRLAMGEPDDIRLLEDALTISVAGLDFIVEHAPGHTGGSVMFRRAETTEDPTVLLSGDVLFEGSIGRTDLPGGDHSQMLNSLRTKVLPLADTTVVLPGHGGTTTIGRERLSNPYLTALASDGGTPSATNRGL